MSRVVLAMSGGVDSSVAAHLLIRAGHDVIGVFMRHGIASAAACRTEPQPAGMSLPIAAPAASHRQGCCSAADAEDARRVADRFDIPFYALNFEEEFGQIVDYFVEEYARARTPNPCIVCNNVLKFGKLFEYADSVGAEFVATGHYARLARHGDEPHEPSMGRDGPLLWRGVDAAKDQSYVLFGVERSYLDRMLLPVGGLRKSQVRALAAELGLGVAEKQDSQEICFVPSQRYREWIRGRLGERDTSGDIVDSRGTVLGRHDGIEAFTVGQRKGLGIALGERRFVLRIDAETRRVVIGSREELAVKEITANRTNWLVDLPNEPFRCAAQIRYRSQAFPATARILEGRRLRVLFDEPVLGVAPGQAVVCYRGDRVLGGGWIESQVPAS